MEAFAAAFCEQNPGIFDEQDTSGFYEKMYHGNEDGFKRKEFYHNREPLSYKDSDFSLRASMDSSHKPTIKVVNLNDAFFHTNPEKLQTLSDVENGN